MEGGAGGAIAAGFEFLGTVANALGAGKVAKRQYQIAHEQRLMYAQTSPADFLEPPQKDNTILYIVLGFALFALFVVIAIINKKP